MGKKTNYWEILAADYNKIMSIKRAKTDIKKDSHLKWSNIRKS